MKFYIYKITNTLTGKIYVGQHKVREGETLRRYMGKGGRLLKDYKKFGRKIFSKEILEYVEDDEKHLLVDEREKFWIKELGADKTGYNVNPGGKNTCLPKTAMLVAATRKAHGYRPSEETKAKMSEAAKGIPKSDIHKQHLSDNHHLKTEHTIVFEDGRESVKTTDAAEKIATKYGVNVTTLRRRSIKGLFTGGIKLLDLLGKETKYNPRLLGKRKCFDPIKKEFCTYTGLICRKTKNPEMYKDVVCKDCIIKEEL